MSNSILLTISDAVEAQQDDKIYTNDNQNYFVVELREKFIFEEILRSKKLKILPRKDAYYIIEWRVIET
jgi:hypothetical protein